MTAVSNTPARDGEPGSPRGTRPRAGGSHCVRRGYGLAVALLLLPLAGCGGCLQSPGGNDAKNRYEEAAKKEKEKPKPPYEILRVVTRPAEAHSLQGLSQTGYFKPGHATSVVLNDVVSNYGELSGEWELTPVGREQEPVPLVASPFTISHFRAAYLPKEQPKSFEALVWIPPVREATHLLCGLSGHGGGRVTEADLGLLHMPSSQYHLLVLSRWPAHYGYLDTLAAINPERAAEHYLSAEHQMAHYHVIRIASGQRPELPSHALYWTSIAYVLWDDADPTALDLDQQRALLDWLHWGGQLIVSGPDSLDALRSTWLAPYLAATSAGTRKLTADDLRELDYWAPRGTKPLQPMAPWPGVRLTPQGGARFLRHTGDLLVERPVGRGRMVVSAFSLGHHQLADWPGLDNFFNACLLRRPPRRTDVANEEERIVWADAKQHPHPVDAALNTKLRYFARDEGVSFQEYAADSAFAEEERAQTQAALAGLAVYNAGSVNTSGDAPVGCGVAAWNDFSPAAKAARTALARAAGINVPHRNFVVWVLAAYLLVLVPLNWAVFRVLGRVEWAWAAAPVIAILYTLLVVHWAQLNIGFARSQNEIGVLELQGDYPRGHLSRYTALYTSLATTYRVRFDDRGALVLPLPSKDPHNFHLLSGQSYQMLTCRRGDATELSGLAVSSNDVKLLHSEHLLDLEGGLSSVVAPDGARHLVNHTGLTFQGAAVLRRAPGGELQGVWLGTVAAGASLPLDLAEVEREHLPWAGVRDRAKQSMANPGEGDLNLHELIALAENVANLRPGQTRLVAWLDEDLPGESVVPAAPQSRHATLVVAHLEQGFDPAPQSDER